MPRFDRDHLPADDLFRPYRKTTVTMAAGPFPAPIEVVTREGEVLYSETPAFLALDSEGWPYPIAVSEFDRIYEPAEEA